MPEGHLLHRYAGQMTADLAGSVVSASSPQGRFDAGAVDGRLLERVDAVGKHLLHRFSGGPVVHVHLGMRGLYLRHDDPAAPPRGGVRLRLAGAATAWDLIAPSTCELLDEAGAVRVLAGLGPDPLHDAPDPDAQAAEAVRRLQAARGPVGAAVLDQAVWAGIGNAWRAELLFLARLDPVTPASALAADTSLQLWLTTREHLALGREAGQVVSDPSAPDERWVYKRDTCRSCGAPVRSWSLAGRTAYACPVEQTG
ncbi:MAG TPA: DNA-formamidopyrimidine glycosylase family protein [Mycobacteriales bacterium]|nr:DNA-formamidopyrimidine glycosylase family protein [Mycobacteriales bacterium]